MRCGAFDERVLHLMAGNEGVPLGFGQFGLA